MSGGRTARGGSADMTKVGGPADMTKVGGPADMTKVETGGSANTTKVVTGLREVDLQTRPKWRQDCERWVC